MFWFVLFSTCLTVPMLRLKGRELFRLKSRSGWKVVPAEKSYRLKSRTGWKVEPAEKSNRLKSRTSFKYNQRAKSHVHVKNLNIKLAFQSLTMGMMKNACFCLNLDFTTSHIYYAVDRCNSTHSSHVCLVIPRQPRNSPNDFGWSPTHVFYVLKTHVSQFYLQVRCV